MRLEQIFAPDTRMAMAQVQHHFGEDSMVVSNRRYNGRNELIAAVDNIIKPAVAPLEPAAAVAAVAPVTTVASAAPAPVTEQQRALSLVELIKTEFQTSRLEMQSLSRLPRQPHTTSKHIIELQRLFMNTGMSARLSQQVLDQLASTKNLQDASSVLSQWIKTQITAYDLVADPAQAHLIAGHPGSGKSTMIARVARQLAMADSSRKIALISFNDDRIGAWQATQIAGARAGADTYRITSFKQLQALYAEISATHHLLIDTAGANIQREIRCITKIIPELKSHLMVAADTNETSALNLLAHPNLNWTSCMVSRLDGIDYPWAIISILANSNIPVSLGSYCTDMTSPPRALSGDFLAHLIDKKVQRHIDSALGQKETTKVPAHIGNPGLKEYPYEQLNFG
tara:strand:- start:4245 stop:5441 length:1197 start_codon:yes stop_codon:yes gene_type:complete